MAGKTRLQSECDFGAIGTLRSTLGEVRRECAVIADFVQRTPDMVSDILRVALVDLRRLQRLCIGAEAHNDRPPIWLLGKSRRCEQEQPGKNEATMAHGASSAAW